MKNSILRYIKHSPIWDEYCGVDLDSMSEEQLLGLVGGTVDTHASDLSNHSYEIIPIPDYSTAKEYEHYAPTWCIFQSESVFYEESLQGKCHFVFCKRDDADDYQQLAFGRDYPYDNYGLSFIALLLTEGNRLMTVTSRRNWDEEMDHYLDHEQLRNALGNELYDATINESPLKVLQISDTHNHHRQLTDLPAADVIVHCGDFSDKGTEEEVLDFLNWYIDLPYPHKIFVVGNHDLCLWDAESIEDLPENVHFLQDRGCEIEGIRFFGLAYDHPECRIRRNVDVLVTHEPPVMILDESGGTRWGNALLRDRVFQIRPRYHLFGHAHDAYGTEEHDGIVFSNGASLNDSYEACHAPKLFSVPLRDYSV